MQGGGGSTNVKFLDIGRLYGNDWRSKILSVGRKRRRWGVGGLDRLRRGDSGGAVAETN